MIRKILRKIFNWIFKEELENLNRIKNQYQSTLDRCIDKEKKLNNILGNIDVNVDVHQYSPSWAVISIQGEKSDYIKFVDLGKSEIKEISNFLKKFERQKIDAYPPLCKFMRDEQKWIKL